MDALQETRDRQRRQDKVVDFVAKMFTSVLLAGVIKVGVLAFGNHVSWLFVIPLAVFVVFAACRVLTVTDKAQAR